MITDIMSAKTSNEERWIRLPAPKTQCQYTGLKRGTLLKLATEGHIKMANLREKGAKRGSVLIWLPSLFEYLNQKAEETRERLESEEVA